MYGINSYYDIVNHVQTAVGEMGYCKYTQEDYADLIKKAKRRGVTDIGGWLADELYNNSSVVNDLVADQLFELISSKYNEDPMNQAVWNKHIAEVNKLMPHVTLG
jgi:predicted amidophosphoribosyltransferase